MRRVFVLSYMLLTFYLMWHWDSLFSKDFTLRRSWVLLWHVLYGRYKFWVIQWYDKWKRNKWFFGLSRWTSEDPRLYNINSGGFQLTKESQVRSTSTQVSAKRSKVPQPEIDRKGRDSFCLCTGQQGTIDPPPPPPNQGPGESVV